MTIQEMHRRINLRLQNIDSGAYDGILPEEIDEYINIAQERFIKSRFEPRGNRLGVGFEQSIKRIEDLRTLIPDPEVISTSNFGSTTLTEFHADYAKFPNNYFIPLNVVAEINYNRDGLELFIADGKRAVVNNHSIRRVQGRFIKQNEMHSVMLDPFNKSTPKRVNFTISDSGIVCYTDNTFVVDKVILSYIRQPTKVSLSEGVSSEISFTDEIVDMTVELILSDIEAFGAEGKLHSLNDSE